MYAPVLVAIWIVIPTFSTFVSYVSTDIIKGVCVPFGVYSSVVGHKMISSAIFVEAYFLPLIVMIFCYSRIVYALRFKVSRHHRLYSRS